jgi:hypothetical protein
MPGSEMADRLPDGFLIPQGQVGVQHQQIPLHAHHFLSLATAYNEATPGPRRATASFVLALRAPC